MKRSIKRYLPIALIITLLSLALSWPAYSADRRVSVKTILSSGTYTAATAYSSSFNVSEYNEGIFFVDATAETGTSTLDVTIQYSPDDSEWYDHTAIAQITATGNYDQTLTNFGKYVRAKYVVGGTDFTFSIKGCFKN